MHAAFVESFDKNAGLKQTLFTGVKKPHINTNVLKSHYNDPATFNSANNAAKKTNELLSKTPKETTSLPLVENSRQWAIRKKVFNSAQSQPQV